MTAATALSAYPFTVRAWRDHDTTASELPGMCLGDIEVDGAGGQAARKLFEAGARKVALPRPVDLTDAADTRWTVRALSFVGDLTSLAIAVDWQVRPGPGSGSWARLNHLHPPTALLDVPESQEALRTWRNGYYICKCVHRQGPGFVQVRDRRFGELRRFIIDEPVYQETIAALADGAPAAALPQDVVDDFVTEELAVRFGDHIWWAPYRVRRWPQAPMVI
ncbi:DUF5825 family protein [Streptomyces silvisoli]|uniref:DUF5825 family protein n=1 Tax=Streptomyces silvisoli TaxID=3034235 RepID=A0ABT5ZUB8_9ACTN|nr:DUF5825 family protein [Streptomyces silvisoli]MDF3292613.1 DUF5825 family protein [Streptomyces silvisoli]